MSLTDGRIRIERVTLSGRDGSSKERLVVRHPGAVVLLPLLDDGRIVLIRNRRFTIDRVLLELPAGTLEGDDPAEAARRELTEETGYQCAHLESLGSFYASPGICDEVMHAFVARGLTEGAQALDPTEEIEVVPMTMTEIELAIRTGELIDGKTLATLMLWRLARSTTETSGRR